MKVHDNCPQLALTNGWCFRDGFEQRYNECRWDASGPLEQLHPRQFPAHLNINGLQQPRWWFFLVSDFSLPQPEKRTDCSQLESFQHPRPSNPVFGRTEGGIL